MTQVFTRQHVEMVKSLPDKEGYLRRFAAKTVELGISRECDQVYQGLEKREGEFSTNLGGGIAIPHTKSEAVLRPAVMVIKPEEPVEWGTEEEKVRIMIAIVSGGENGGKAHLQLLSSLARHLIEDEFKEKLVGASDSEEIFLLVNSALHE